MPTSAAKSLETVGDLPFRWIVEQSLAGIYVIQDEVFRYVNPTFLVMLGRNEDEVIGHGLEAIARPNEARKIIENVRRRINGEIAQIRYVVELQHRDGRSVFMEVDGARMEFQGRAAVVGIGLDISEATQRKRELERSRQQLRELTAYINTMREAQRGKLARELHDQLGGMLSSLKLDINRLKRKANSDELLDLTREIECTAQNAIDTVRRLAEDLRPGVLDHLGLLAAIKGHLQAFQKQSEIKCILNPEELPVELSQTVATAAYRIFQEALTNIGKHSGAQTVTVNLTVSCGVLRMQIDDDGVGIENTKPRRAALGLLGMAERARELGGSIEFGTGVPRGTRVLLHLPANYEADES